MNKILFYLILLPISAFAQYDQDNFDGRRIYFDENGVVKEWFPEMTIRKKHYSNRRYMSTFLHDFTNKFKKEKMIKGVDSVRIAEGLYHLNCRSLYGHLNIISDSSSTSLRRILEEFLYRQNDCFVLASFTDGVAEGSIWPFITKESDTLGVISLKDGKPDGLSFIACFNSKRRLEIFYDNDFYSELVLNHLGDTVGYKENDEFIVHRYDRVKEIYGLNAYYREGVEIHSGNWCNNDFFE